MPLAPGGFGSETVYDAIEILVPYSSYGVVTCRMSLERSRSRLQFSELLTNETPVQRTEGGGRTRRVPYR